MRNYEKVAIRSLLFLRRVHREKRIDPPQGMKIPADLRRALKEEISERSLQNILDHFNHYMLLAAHPVHVRLSIRTPGTELIVRKPWGKETVIQATYTPGNPACVELAAAQNCDRDWLLAVVTHEMAHHYHFGHRIDIPPGFDNEKLTDYTAVYLDLGRFLVKPYKPVETIGGDCLHIATLGYVSHTLIKFARGVTKQLRDPPTPIATYVRAGRLVKEAVGKVVMLKGGRSVLVSQLQREGHKFSAFNLDTAAEASFMTGKVL